MITFSKWLVCLLLMTAATHSAAQQLVRQPISQPAGQTAALASRQVKPEIIWLDVRSWGEYQLDHIDGDRRIAHTEIVGEVGELFPDKSTPIRLYCASGGRAGNAAERLTAAGYVDIQNAGGIAQARLARFGAPVSAD